MQRRLLLVGLMLIETSCFLQAQHVLWSETDEQTLFTIDQVEFTMPAEPGQLSFLAKRSPLGLGSLYVEVYNNSQWQSVQTCSLSTSYQSFGPYLLPHTATKIRFSSQFGSTLYKYIKNIVVTKAHYIEASPLQLFLPERNQQQLSVAYAELTQPLYLDLQSSHFYLPSSFFNPLSVDTNGIQTILITFAPDSIGDYNDTIFLHSDSLIAKVPLKGTYAMSAHQQQIVWNQSLLNLVVGDTIILTATATSSLPVSYSANADSIIHIDGDTLIALNQGLAQVVVSQQGDEWYAPASTIRAYVAVSLFPVSMLEASLPDCFIYPNPVTTFFTVQGPSFHTLQLFDLLGHRVCYWHFNSTQSETIQLPPIASGYYLLQITGSQWAQPIPLIVK